MMLIYDTEENLGPLTAGRFGNSGPVSLACVGT
jgi:hypothetical protein